MADESFVLLPDTNILLHYRRLDEIDWPGVASARQVLLLLAPAIFRELNKHKDNPAQRRSLRNRAASLILYLDNLFATNNEVPLRDNVRIALLPYEPTLDFSANHLSPQFEDDQLLASAIEYRDANPGAQITIVTADTGLRAKVRYHNLSSVRPPDDLKLADEPDPVEKELQEARAELQDYQRRAPKLAIGYASGGAFMVLPIHTPREIDDQKLAEALADLRAKFPKEPSPVAGLHGVSAFGAITRPNIERYNAELDDFYAAWEQWAREWFSYKNAAGRVAHLPLALHNTGTTPADDVDVFLDVPSHVLLYREDTLPTEPDQPKAPDRPTDFLTYYARSNLAIPPMYSSFGPPVVMNRPTPNVHPPEVDVAGHRASIHVERVKHGLSLGLGDLYVAFASDDEQRSFQVAYRVCAANLPQPLTGTLHVKVEPAEDDAGG